MTPLGAALRAKYKTPREALAALGLDASLITTAGLSGDTVETEHMSKKPMRLSPMAAASKGAISAVLLPLMAADSKPDFAKLVKGVTKKGWATDKARIVAGLPALVKGTGPKLATDAEVGSIVKQVEKLLDTINPAEEGMDDDPDMGGGMDKEWGEDDEKAFEELNERRAKAKTAEDEAETEAEKAERMKARKEAGANDAEPETESEKKMRMDKRAEDKSARDAELAAATGIKPGAVTAKDAEKEPVTKGAMDAALAALKTKLANDHKADLDRVQRETQTATMTRMEAIATAKALVDPLVGKLAIACDSAEAVYRHSLKSLGLAVDGINDLAALKLLVDQALLHKNAATPVVNRPALGMDTAQSDARRAFEQSRLGTVLTRPRLLGGE